jgi:hypothetical protein
MPRNRRRTLSRSYRSVDRTRKPERQSEGSQYGTRQTYQHTPSVRGIAPAVSIPLSAGTPEPPKSLVKLQHLSQGLQRLYTKVAQFVEGWDRWRLVSDTVYSLGGRIGGEPSQHSAAALRPSDAGSLITI